LFPGCVAANEVLVVLDAWLWSSVCGDRLGPAGKLRDAGARATTLLLNFPQNSLRLVCAAGQSARRYDFDYSTHM